MFRALSARSVLTRIDVLTQNVLKKISLVDVDERGIVDHNQLFYVERMLEQIHILMLVGRNLNIREVVVRLYMVIY